MFRRWTLGAAAVSATVPACRMNFQPATSTNAFPTSFFVGFGMMVGTQCAAFSTTIPFLAKKQVASRKKKSVAKKKSSATIGVTRPSAVDQKWAGAWGEAATAVRRAREAALRMKPSVSPEAAGAENFEMIATFVLVKEFWATSSDRLRPLLLELLVKPDDEESKGWRDRLDRLLTTEGDTTFDSPPKAWSTLEGFCQAHPAWLGDGAYIHRRRDGKVPQRHQPSGLCYMHAPVVQQHYLIERSNANHEGMIDVVKMIRGWRGRALHWHILKNEGGDSVRTLRSILHPGSQVHERGIVDIIVKQDLKKVENNLKQYGPALISRFDVFEDFYAGGAQKTTFAGSPRGKSMGHHAMVLLGIRKDEAGKYFFLLQNWWKQMQFVEVDEEYLKVCGANVAFVSTEQKSIPRKLPKQSHLLAENENVDKPEEVMSEYDPVPSPDQMQP